MNIVVKVVRCFKVLGHCQRFVTICNNYNLLETQEMR